MTAFLITIIVIYLLQFGVSVKYLNINDFPREVRITHGVQVGRLVISVVVLMWAGVLLFN